ncbi:acetylornithine deacetylase [Rhodovibrio salinarum]|uniref:Acetylornithine deacetylase n=1 Tax=Rhodovibrio salinarum TaxID=1087 RepID=A0A934QKU4_9PROT|nr:acetylornithine deacetylase [Rhodovibrio salinarum]MBK1698782.1 acetylornithine deacetylase [Rhodovibrio salinarum]
MSSTEAQPSAETRRILRDLIAFDTVSRNSNLDLIDYVQSALADLGIESELTHDDTGRKANLYATIGPQDRGGIALSGHTDVVPVDGQPWSSDPFALYEADGKLYGRGTADMKGFVAAVLAYAPAFAKAQLNEPVHLCFSYDEEVGCLGVQKLLAPLMNREVRPRAAIIGEPTGMEVINAHKGKLSTCAEVRGFACHSAYAPEGVNAALAAARLTAKLGEIAERKATEGPFDSAYDIPHTTVHVGVLEGGTALNIVPDAAKLHFEIRNLPNDDPHAILQEAIDYARQELEPAMQSVQAETGFSFHRLSHFPALDTDPGDDVVVLAKALAGKNATGKVAFGTEAGRFKDAGIPAVVCGPGYIAQAHKPDEFVGLDQLAACERFLAGLLDRLSA